MARVIALRGVPYEYENEYARAFSMRRVAGSGTGLSELSYLQSYRVYCLTVLTADVRVRM